MHKHMHELKHMHKHMNKHMHKNETTRDNFCFVCCVCIFPRFRRYMKKSCFALATFAKFRKSMLAMAWNVLDERKTLFFRSPLTQLTQGVLEYSLFIRCCASRFQLPLLQSLSVRFKSMGVL